MGQFLSSYGNLQDTPEVRPVYNGKPEKIRDKGCGGRKKTGDFYGSESNMNTSSILALKYFAIFAAR